VNKVVAYIVRDKRGRRELLVFRHRDHPEAGLQVPAGTVRYGEDIRAALVREISEETGLELTGEPVRLGVFDYPNYETGQINERHVFVVATSEEIPDQ
jgi:ADP-ribose pyrophosphatase YjhB (NUDIX family)